MTREQAVIAWMRSRHVAYKQGSRTPDVMAGERAYQKWRKRCQRATQHELEPVS